MAVKLSRRRLCILTLLGMCVASISLAAWISEFGKVIIFNSVWLRGVSQRNGVLTIWYFHPPVTWNDDIIGVDYNDNGGELELQFVVTQSQWPFASVDREAVYDKAVDAFRVDIPNPAQRRAIAVSRHGARSDVWPLSGPIPPKGLNVRR